MRVLLAICIVLSGCASLTERLGQAQLGAVEARKAATTYMDARCLSVERACPKKSADAKLSDCTAYVQCVEQRHTIYQAATSLQLAIHAAVAMAAIDAAKAETMLSLIASEVVRLWGLLRWGGLIGDTTPVLPASLPAGGGS